MYCDDCALEERFIININLCKLNRVEYINFIKIVINYYCMNFGQNVDDIAKDLFYVDLDNYERKNDKKNGKEKL